VGCKPLFFQFTVNIYPGRRCIVRPDDQSDPVLLTKFLLYLIELLTMGQSFLTSEKFYRMIMLDALIFDRCFKGRNIQVQTLPPQPVRTVLVQSVGVYLSDFMEESQFIFPFRPDDPFRGKSRPYPGPCKPPVGGVTILLFL